MLNVDMDAVVSNIDQRRILMRDRKRLMCTAVFGDGFARKPENVRETGFRYTPEDCRVRSSTHVRRPRGDRLAAERDSLDSALAGTPRPVIWGATTRQMTVLLQEPMDARRFENLKKSVVINAFVHANIDTMLDPSTRMRVPDPVARAEGLLSSYLGGLLHRTLTVHQRRVAVVDILMATRMALDRRL